MEYYDLKRHWTKRIMPHLGDTELNKILVRDFNKFTRGLWKKEFVAGDMPADFESCDWRFDIRGPYPRYWEYVKHAACHWICNFSLRLAILVEPERPWRIITSDAHSTVWDGKTTLFDFNYQALGITPKDCYKAARKARRARMLPIGKQLRVHYAIRNF